MGNCVSAKSAKVQDIDYDNEPTRVFKRTIKSNGNVNISSIDGKCNYDIKKRIHCHQHIK